MIELYVLASLAAVGYILNSSNSKKETSGNYKIPKSNMPSSVTPYQSRHVSFADQSMRQKAERMYKASQEPVKSSVIDKNFGLDKEQHMQKKIKSLTGEYVDENSFKHNNMTPYFGGRMKQSVDDGANASRLESFTGTSQSAYYKQKCEVASFYDNSKDVTNVNGMQNKDEFYRDRIVGSTMRNNETPVEKVYVGPGMNQGYSSTPSGGFHQFNVQDVVRPKCVDELRVASKPKVTFEGRTVDGVKSKLRGDVGKFDKNRPDTYYEQTEDHFLKTTGANLKPTQIPQFNVKSTHRLDTTTEYTGTAISTNAKARAMEPGVRGTTKDQLGEYGLRNAALQQYGKGNKTDYGKSTIMVFANERDITTTRVHQGNLTSIVKAIVAPIEDLFKNTKKEEFVDNPRHFGNMNAQIPDKPAVYDPNDVARTTIKETTIHESINGNLKGAEKGTIYDPNDTARTTTKETTIHEYINANLKGNEKLTLYDPNDIARTTTKETTIHESTNANFKGNEKLTIYDPNDIARTTIKETLIHDDLGTGTITGPKQLFVYDPDEVAKITGRETLERMDYEMNLAGGAKKATVYDPNDKARTTMKETTEHNLRNGNIDGVEGMGDYATTEYDAKNTQKQFVSDNDYYGQAMRSINEGYQTNEMSAKNTQKQFLSDKDYYGGAEASNKAQKSYEDIYNAHISSSQESLLHARDPTQSGKKQTISKDCVNMSNRKQECSAVSTRASQNVERVNSSAYADVSENGVTRMKKEYGSENDRLDPSILKAYLENPYTKPLNSVA